MQCNELLKYLDELLDTSAFSDYCPLGLQIEGHQEIKKIVTAVTSSFKVIDFAIQQRADMLLVHHGMFWKNEPVAIVGWKKRRIKALLEANINLVAYHLPLDAHPKFGNNIQLAHAMHWVCLKMVGEQGLLCVGELENTMTLEVLEQQLEIQLARKPLVIGEKNKRIKKIAWCTGGAQNFFLEAVSQRVDAFITGEASEAQYHLANECDVAFIAAGHHATERYGILSLGQHIQEKFNLEVVFFDEDNPI